MFERPKPRWWLLFGILPLMVGLLLIESRLAADSNIHKLLEMLIVVLAFGLMWLWVLANQAALAVEQEQDDSIITVIYDSTLDEPLHDDEQILASEIGDWEPVTANERYN